MNPYRTPASMWVRGVDERLASLGREIEDFKRQLDALRSEVAQLREELGRSK